MHGTDEADTLRILRHADGAVEIVLAGSDGPYFRRRFLPGETDEVRVFLKGGDDRAISEGRAEPGVKRARRGRRGQRRARRLRGGHTRFYDSDGENRVSHGPGTKDFTRPYDSPLDRQGNPERDWGAQTRFLPWVRASVDYGAVLGAARAYGLRLPQAPLSRTEHTLRAGYSTSLRTGGLLYEYESLRTDSRSRLHVAAPRASALDLIHFYGFGNETDSTEADDFYDVRVLQLALAPSYRLDLSGVDISAGAGRQVRGHAPDEPRRCRRRSSRTARSGFGQVGARAGLDHRSSQDSEAGRATGALLVVEGDFYPGVWSVSEAFGAVDGEGVAYAHGPAAARAHARAPGGWGEGLGPLSVPRGGHHRRRRRASAGCAPALRRRRVGLRQRGAAAAARAARRRARAAARRLRAGRRRPRIPEGRALGPLAHRRSAAASGCRWPTPRTS